MCADFERKRLILIGSLQGLFICFYDSWQHEINQQRLSETSRVDILLWSILLLFKFSPEDWDRGTDKGLLKSRLPNQLKNIWHSDSFQAPPPVQEFIPLSLTHFPVAHFVLSNIQWSDRSATLWGAHFRKDAALPCLLQVWNLKQAAISCHWEGCIFSEDNIWNGRNIMQENNNVFLVARAHPEIVIFICFAQHRINTTCFSRLIRHLS